MITNSYTQPFPFIHIENFYSEYELKLIFQELQFYINNVNIFANDTGPATNPETGEVLKSNAAVFLDGIYKDRSYSHILNFNRKLFSEILNPQDSWYFKELRPDRDHTLLSYYESGDYYKAHNDKSVATCCTWLYKEPKHFSGGDLSFVDFDITIECKHNHAVIFPGSVLHQVSPVSIDPQYSHKGYGRYCISQFLNYN